MTDETPGPDTPHPRRTLRWAGGVLAVAVLGVALGEATGWPFLRGPLERQVAQAAGVPVRLEGRFRLHLFGRPGLQVEHLNIAPGGGVKVPHLLDARSVDLGWRWGDLLAWRRGGPLRVQRLHAGVVDAHLVRGADGRASWQLGADRGLAEGEAREPLAGLPRFGSLRVQGGRIEVDDKPSDTRLRVELQGGEGDASPASRPAGYQATVTGRYRALPLALRVHAGSTLPLLEDTESGSDAVLTPVRVEGEAGAARLRFDGQAGALLGARRVQGVLRFRGPSLALVGEPLGITLPQTPPFDLAGELGHAGGVWQLRAERATIGRSVLNGDFRFDTRTRPGRLTGRLGGTRLLLADLGPAVGAPAPGAAAPRPSGKVLPQRRFDLPSLRAMDADVQVAIEVLDFGSPAVAPLRGLQTQLLLQGGLLTLKDLKAGVPGGEFTGTTRLDANADPAQWTTELRFSMHDISGWLRSMQTPTQTPPQTRQGGQAVRAWLTGQLTGQVQARGSGRSTAEILSTLDGQAQLTLRNGSLSHLVTELAGLDVAEALGVLIGQDDALPLRCARIDLVVRQGVVQPRLAVLDSDDTTLRMAGRIDLRHETLALRVEARPKDASPLAFRTPITVTGTLADPVLGVESGKLAGKVLGALALGVVVGPAAALLPLIEWGTNDAGDPCAEQPRDPAAPAAPRTAGKPAGRERNDAGSVNGSTARTPSGR